VLVGRSFCAGVLVAALVAGAATAQDRTAELRARFEKEPDSVRKAGLVAPLADAEFRDMHAKIDAGDLAAAAEIAEHVRDEATASKKALDAKRRDAEAHPEGYKKLEISVRESVRRLDDILVSLAKDDQKPLAEIRVELETLDRELIHQLFPKRPEASPAAPATTPAPDADKPKN
jgi:hypothetical protein